MSRNKEHSVYLSVELTERYLTWVDKLNCSKMLVLRRALMLYLDALEADQVILVKRGVETVVKLEL